MENGLFPSLGLQPARLEQIRRLATVCNQFEALTMKLNWSRLQQRPRDEQNDFLYFDAGQLVGYLALYTFNQRETEISAMVAPTHRRQGIFLRILAATREEVRQRGIPSMLFICEQKSPGGQAVMQAIGAVREFSEYRMELKQAVIQIEISPQLQLRPAQMSDVPLLAQMDELCFQVPVAQNEARLRDNIQEGKRKQAFVAEIEGKVIGKIQVLKIDREAVISAFCMLPELRDQGYGKVILRRVVAALIEQGHRHISLEVETKNERALNIYRRCGFDVVTAYDYFRLPINS